MFEQYCMPIIYCVLFDELAADCLFSIPCNVTCVEWCADAGMLMWRAVQLGSSFTFQSSPLFFALLLFTMLERLTSFASDVAIERDWLTQLVGGATHLHSCTSAVKLLTMPI